MNSYPFIVRDPEDREICSKELFVDTSCMNTARVFMDLVRQEYPLQRVDHCEVWKKVSPFTMHIMVTVF